eukprot:c11313_g1_i5 orf=3-347(-)
MHHCPGGKMHGNSIVIFFPLMLHFLKNASPSLVLGVSLDFRLSVVSCICSTSLLVMALVGCCHRPQKCLVCAWCFLYALCVGHTSWPIHAISNFLYVHGAFCTLYVLNTQADQFM